MKVLVVDDNELLAENLCELLEDAGHQAEAVFSSEAALAKDPCFDAYVSDVRMPGLDGWGLRARLLDRCPDARFVLITAYAQPGVGSMKAGARPLPKPVPIDVLLERLA